MNNFLTATNLYPKIHPDMANNHEEKIRKTETECVEIKRQMLKFEFQHKKDIAAIQKETAELKKNPSEDGNALIN